MATSPLRAPLIEDIIYHVGLCLLPEPWEKPPSPAEHGYFKMDMACLRRLTYLSRATKRLLEPLLYRFVFLATWSEVVQFYIDLVQRPWIREYVRHMACVTNRRSSMDIYDIRANLMLKRTLNERIGGRENKLSLMKQGAAWEPYVQACSETRTKKTPEERLGQDLNMDRDVDYMIRSILLTTTKLKTLVWTIDEPGMKGRTVDQVLKQAFWSGHVPLPDLEVMTLKPWPGCHLEGFPWQEGFWKNLRRLVLHDTDFDDDFWHILVLGLGPQGVMPAEEFIVRRRPKVAYLNIMGDESMGRLLRAHMTGLSRTFEKLKLLEISFGYFQRRNERGSSMLDAFLRCAGAPERLRLTGHPPPLEALARGTVHSRLKSIQVEEWKDEEDLGQDEMRQNIEEWWRNHSAVVPNLEEFVVQRIEEGKVYVKKP
ncbi:hypothetical protein N0V84_004258 [Fusarium piperis]|uniref:Uncharacterized protein n=1 Tax=Fusarium piperis TaxID=1435070 RepID=A0A9W8WFX0_9HYPO|nr:hypothetical protein N0V84_004258 [Fusarium piperis]